MEKTIVIIGGSDGIGKNTLISLLKENHNVYNLSRNEIDKFQKNIVCDVSNLDSIRNAFNQLYKNESKVDVLIYCAGFSMADAIDEAREKDYQYLYDVILHGYIESVRNVIINFKKNKSGKIIFLSSLASSVPIPYDPYYCSAKAAVEMFNRTLNIEINKENIYITNLIFGGVQTNFTYKRKVNRKSRDMKLYNAVNTLGKIEQEGRRSEEITNAILKIIDMEKPPINYVVGIKEKIIFKLSKVLSSKMVNGIVKLKYKIN